MLKVRKSYFAVLNDEEGGIDRVTVPKFTNPTPNKAGTPLPLKHHTQINQQKAKPTADQMRAKPLVLPGHANTGVLPPAATAALHNHMNKWGSRWSNGGDNKKASLEKEQEEDPSALTLKEYEKQIFEKKAASKSPNMSIAEQQRMVDVSEDFKSMKLVGKKKPQLKMAEKEKTVKKNFGSLSEKKVGKTMSFNELFKPVERQSNFSSNNHTQFRVLEKEQLKADTVFRSEDAKQFPSLGETFQK